MKRKPDNISKKDTNKRQKLLRNCDQLDAHAICERRRKEIFEIIAEENSLASEVPKNDTSPTINNDPIPPEAEVLENDTSLTINNEDHISPEAQENDLNNIDEDTTDFKLFVHKEKQKTLKEYKVISKDKVKLALSMLKEEKKQPKNKASQEEKRFAILKKRCNKNVWHFNMQEPDHTWQSSMYIIKNIRSCILTRKWNNLTHLLLMLLKYRKAYIPFIKQTDNGHLQTVTPRTETQVLNEIEDFWHKYSLPMRLTSLGMS